MPRPASPPLHRRLPAPLAALALTLPAPHRRLLAPLAALALTLAAPRSALAAPPTGPSGHVPPTIISPDFGLPPLESLGDGRLRFRGPGFNATIHPDGSVKFRDIADHDYKFSGFDIRRRRLEPSPLDKRSPLVVDFEERAMFPMGRLPVAAFGGRMGGLADWTIGQKHVAAKRAFLDATAGLRYRLAYAWQRARAQEQLAGLADRLLAIWRDPKLPLAERKRLLFDLWDECDDLAPSAPSPFDALRGAAGHNARLKIAAFVRLVAPPGTPDAYTPDELTRLNAARRSVTRFDPYLPDATTPPDLPELPPEAAPDPPRDAPEPEPETYGPIPEPTVALPPPKPEPERPPPPKRDRKDPYNRVKIGPLNIPVGRK